MVVGLSSSEAGNDGDGENPSLGDLLLVLLPQALVSDDGETQPTALTVAHETLANRPFSHPNRETTVQDVKPIGLPKGDLGDLQVIRNSDLECLRLLGHGSYGEVYLGKWRATEVAIKKIKGKEGILVADFWKEVNVIAQLRHPNVVAFYGVVLDDFGELEGIVMEYMIDGSLSNAIYRKDRFSRINNFRTKASIALQTAVAMAYIHGEGVVHLDVRSDNLFVDLRDPENPICKIGDFGLSKFKNEVMGLTYEVGIIQWMAPELLDGSGWISEKVDVYSFGTLLWELVIGELPFPDRSSSDVKRVLSEGLLPEVPSWVDYDWGCLMDLCWHLDPSMRPAFTRIVSELNFVIDNFAKKFQFYSRS